MNLMSKRVFAQTVGAFALMAALAWQVQAQQQSQTPGQDKSPGQPGQPGQRPGLDQRQGQYRSGTFDENTWIKQTAQHDLLEVKLGELASQKTDNSSVKQFGDRLVKDHKKSCEKLEEIALKQGVMLEKELDTKHKQMLDKFESYSGEEFNREFAKHAIKGHVKAIAQFQRASQEAKDEELRTFARETLPTLRQHLKEARDIAKIVGIDEATITSLMQEPPAVGAPGIGIEIERGAGEKKDSFPKDDKPENEKNDQPKQ